MSGIYIFSPGLRRKDGEISREQRPLNHSITIIVIIIPVAIARTIIGLQPISYFGILGDSGLGSSSLLSENLRGRRQGDYSHDFFWALDIESSTFWTSKAIDIRRLSGYSVRLLILLRLVPELREVS